MANLRKSDNKRAEYSNKILNPEFTVEMENDIEALLKADTDIIKVLKGETVKIKLDATAIKTFLVLQPENNVDNSVA